MAYDNTNRFTLSRNERKEADTHPEYTGSLNVDGVEYWLSAWVKESNGKRFFSGSIKPKQARSDSDRPAKEEIAPLDDDFPF